MAFLSKLLTSQPLHGHRQHPGFTSTLPAWNSDRGRTLSFQAVAASPPGCLMGPPISVSTTSFRYDISSLSPTPNTLSTVLLPALRPWTLAQGIRLPAPLARALTSRAAGQQAGAGGLAVLPGVPRNDSPCHVAFLLRGRMTLGPLRHPWWKPLYEAACNPQVLPAPNARRISGPSSALPSQPCGPAPRRTALGHPNWPSVTVHVLDPRRGTEAHR